MLPACKLWTGVAFHLPGGLRVEAETAPPAAYHALLHALTGSEAHRARLVERAARLGLVVGLSVPPTVPSWGNMLADGRSYLTTSW